MAVKRYKIKYKASEYTFPDSNPQINTVQFDNDYLHVDLVDGRKVSIPLHWIPTLYNAIPADREQYEIADGMLYYDPDKVPINDTIVIRDYLAGTSAPRGRVEASQRLGVALENMGELTPN